MSKKTILYIGNKLGEHGKSPTTADTLPPALAREGYEIITASNKKNKFFRLIDMVFVTYTNRKKIDLVLIDTYSTWNFYYAVIIAAICRNYNLPYIPILHGGNLANRLEKSKFLSFQLFKNAKINVSPSKYLQSIFEDNGIFNIIHIPNTLPLENYTFLQRKFIKPKLLWVRSFSEIYNPLLALEIVEILKKQGVDAELCMVGPEKDGAMERCKKVVNELNLPITFTGLIPKDQWVQLSKKFDIFINTTNFDNMPVSVMEAMALGMPVISTKVGGMPYLIDSGVNGILVSPNNAQHFVEAIKVLCNEPLKTETISRNAREKAEIFDWEAVKNQWIKLIDF